LCINYPTKTNKQDFLIKGISNSYGYHVMIKMRLLLGIGILVFSGCAEVHYVKAGATEADLKADRLECQNQVLMSPSGPVIASGPMGKPEVREGITTQSSKQSAQRDLDQCLQSKGWRMEIQ